MMKGFGWSVAAAFSLSVSGCSDADREKSETAPAEVGDANFWPFGGADNFRMIVDPAEAPSTWRLVAEQKCGDRDYCMVLGWTDGAKAPVVLPMTDSELAAQAFAYRRNRSTGLDEALWDCSRYPQKDASACMSKGE